MSILGDIICGNVKSDKSNKLIIYDIALATFSDLKKIQAITVKKNVNITDVNSFKLGKFLFFAITFKLSLFLFKNISGKK